MRNNCYFISRAETSSTAVGMRGGRESSQSAFCFKLQDSVREEEEEVEEEGATHGRRALWWRCRCCLAERCVRSLCSPALCSPPPPRAAPSLLLRCFLVNLISTGISLRCQDGDSLTKCTFLIEYTTNAAATAPGHTENSKVIRD